MTAAIDITASQRKTLLALLRRYIPGVAVWAYGSRVKWTARPNSDLDLVAFTTPAQQPLVSELKEALAESNLPFLVDFHVWDEVPERFHEIIRKEYVVFQDAAVNQVMREAACDYPITRVGDLADSISETHKMQKERLIFLNTSDILHGKFLHHTYSVVKDWPGQAKKSIRKDDILFSEIRPANGRWAFVENEADDYVVSTKLMVIRARKDRVFPKFLYQYLTSTEITSWLQHLAESRSGTFPQITFDEVASLELPLPPISEQKNIANIIGVLNDKIELNRRMNATLEAMARALFQSWFVDFDPVRAKLDGRQPTGLDAATAALFPEHFEHGEDGMLPVGWQAAAIEKLCAINAWTLSKNDDLKVLEYVEISEVNRGNIANIATYTRGEEPSRARRRLRHGDTVLSTVRPDRGSYFLALYPPENRVASTGFAVLTPTKAPWSFIHAAMTQPEVSDYLGQMADGGAYPAVRPEIIGSMKVALPNEPKILEAFHRTCAPLFEQAEANRAQSRTLATLRDALLPKLLSGDIRVTNVEDEVASV